MKMVLLSGLEAFGLNLQVFHRILVKSRKRVQKSEEKKKKQFLGVLIKLICKVILRHDFQDMFLEKIWLNNIL